MATLAYPVVQSTSTYNAAKLKTAVNNLKPNGKSQIYSGFLAIKTTLDTLKPSGTSQVYSKFTNIKSVTDTKKLSLILTNSAWVPSTSTKVKATNWTPIQIASILPSTTSNLKNTIRVSSWNSTLVSFEKSSVDPMKPADLTIGMLVTPYNYETFSIDSMAMTKLTIANSLTVVPVVYSYNEKMLSMKSGSIAAFGVAPKQGWVI